MAAVFCRRHPSQTQHAPRRRSERDSLSDRDGQFSCSHGFNHLCQIFRVLFGNEGDGADPGILVCVGGRAGYRGERTVFIHLSHKILRRLSSDCVGDDIDRLEIRECRWIIECSQAISAKVLRAIQLLSTTKWSIASFHAVTEPGRWFLELGEDEEADLLKRR
jgi:hypothetical protein